tara:strand:+ start:1598 stop:2497 length:900 start_codon:yes stop_codon:yes gene_type:complete
MSFTLIEKANSRSYTLTQTPGESSITIQYLMTWSSASTTPTEAQILAAANPPPSRISSAIYTGNSYLKTMVIREVTIEPVRERQNAWTVTHRASTRDGIQLDKSGSYCTCTRATVIRSTAMYRKNASLPSAGTVTFSGAADIGGLKVDTNGKPKVYDVPQQLVTIETQYDRTLPQALPAAEPLWSTYTGYVGNRNSAEFLGFPIGTLLYQGFQTAPEENYYRMSHTFLYDAWMHLDQIPAPNPTGEPLLTAGVSIGGVPILQVDKVVYLQRYDTLSAFSGILAGVDLTALTSPQPLAVV